MKMLILTLAVLVGGQLFGQVSKAGSKKASPTEKASPSKKINQPGWQYAKWGMTTDQIVEASKGAARAVSGEEQKGNSNEYFYTCMAVSEFSTGPFIFEVNFRAKKGETTLNSVNLALKDPLQYNDLRNSLISKYGQGKVTEHDRFDTEIEWIADTEIIKLREFRQYIHMVNLQYIDRPKGLDL